MRLLPFELNTFSYRLTKLHFIPWLKELAVEQRGAIRHVEVYKPFHTLIPGSDVHNTLTPGLKRIKFVRQVLVRRYHYEEAEREMEKRMAEFVKNVGDKVLVTYKVKLLPMAF